MFPIWKILNSAILVDTKQGRKACKSSTMDMLRRFTGKKKDPADWKSVHVTHLLKSIDQQQPTFFAPRTGTLYSFLF